MHHVTNGYTPRVPEISRFFGIVVRMFSEPGRRHARPHLHAYYQGAACVVAFDFIEVIGGSLPPKQLRLLLAWVEIHHDELVTDWGLLVHGRQPFKIDPLR
jgi:hypothetical protein